jgi:hypothetical protein
MRAIAILLPLCLASPAAAWTEVGHQRVARATLDSLPAELAFLQGYRARAAHHAVQPDVHTAAPALAAHERPDHYLDVDLLPGIELPRTRAAYEAWLREAGKDATKVGAAIYRIEEETERLTVLFAQHRRAPESSILRTALADQIGKLSHYTSDLVQPLHTTKDYDGRDGARTGIHLVVDGWLGRLPEASLAPQPGVACPDLRQASLERLREAHSYIEAVYAAHEAGPPAGPLGDKARALAEDRWTAAVAFTTAVVRHAWERSAGVELPAWVPRPAR